MPKLLSLESLINAIKLSRFNNLLIIFITQYLCAIFLIGPAHNWMEIIKDIKLLSIVAGTISIAAAGYYINDYYDIKIDLVNKPAKVIVGTDLKRRPVLAAHIFMNLIGIVLGVWVSVWIGLVNLVSVFLLWLYSNQLKRMPIVGNIVVGMLTAASLLILTLYFQKSYLLVFIYAYFAGFLTLVREIIKDIEDIEGDAAFGSDTLPIAVGLRKTKSILLGLLALFAMSILYFLMKINLSFLYVYFGLLAIPFIYFVYLLARADTKNHFAFLSKYCKWLMLAGVFSMMFISR